MDNATPAQTTDALENALQGVSITAIAQGLLGAEKMLARYQKLKADAEPPLMEALGEEELRKMFGAKIRIMRKLRGLTQQELANKIDATQSTITNVENGRRAPSLKNLVGFATALNVSADWLLDIQAPRPE